MRTVPVYTLAGWALSGAAAFDPDPNDPLVNTPPELGDDDYGTRCQRWGLTEACDYMIGDEANTQINRAKKWKIISGGPLNKRLYHDDDTNPEEHVMVELSCSTTNQPSDQPGKTARFYFNGMTEDDIMFRYDETGRMDPDEPLWPYQNPCTGNLLKPLHGDNLPTYSAGGTLENPSERIARPAAGQCDHHGNYAHNSEATFDNADEYVSCDADERLLIRVYDRTTIEAQDSGPIDAGRFNPGEVGCLETNDEVKYYTNYGARAEAATGNDKCFNNRNDKYIQEPTDPNFNRDLPWHPYDNCYKARETGELTAYSFADCERSSMQLFLKVEDDAALNSAQTPPLPSPMRQEHLVVRASIAEIYDTLEILPADIMRVDFYIEKGGVSKP